MLYLNFEDDRLLPLKIQDMEAILEAYFRRYPENKAQRCTFFLDEIQRVTGWEQFVRRILDTENISVVVTGSSSRMLSREIATCLRAVLRNGGVSVLVQGVYALPSGGGP